MTAARAIVNPSSGRERATEHLDLIQARLGEHFSPLDIVLTEGEGDARRAASAAVEAGCRHLFVAGGDGTLNEAVNGVMEAGGLAAMTFGVVPFGTGNDFAAALGIPAEVDRALDVLVRRRAVFVDVGEVNGRAFVNISGGGFIEVSQSVSPQLKTVAGRMAYLLGGAQALLEYEPARATVAAEPGGIRLGLGLHAFAVCNSRLIGGGRLIAPEAIIDDGLLDVCLIEAMSTLEFVTLVRKVAAGGHVGDPRVRYHRASSMTMTFDREVAINTDGEVLSARQCQYAVRVRAARFLAGEAAFVSNA